MGILALKMAEDLMQSETLDYCLVVGAEEVDWLLCDAYDKWRLLRSHPPIELFSRPPGGMILSEGAGAALLGRKGHLVIDKISAGGNYPKQKDASTLLGKIFRELELKESSLLVASANGTFVDLAELDAASAELPNALIYSLKGALGESVGASALWQTIAGAQTLLTGKVPPSLHTVKNRMLRVDRHEVDDIRSAIVSACGLNQQIAGLRLRLEH